MSVKRVLINKSDTGFGLSKEAHELFLKLAHIPYTPHVENFKPILLKVSKLDYTAAITNAKDSSELLAAKVDLIHHCSDIPRDHPALWEVAENMGLEAMNDRFSKLEFVEVPEDKSWGIKEYNGIEYITIDPNPVPQFTGSCSNWYPSDFKPAWMRPEKDMIVLAGRDDKGITRSMICGWGNVLHNLVTLTDYKWYPLSKLCPYYNAK